MSLFTWAIAMASVALPLGIAYADYEEQDDAALEETDPESLPDDQREAFEDLAQSYNNAMSSLELAKEQNDEDSKRYGQLMIKELEQAIARAQKAKLPDDARFAIGGHPMTTFAQVRSRFAAMRAEDAQNLADVKAADAAKRAPFAAVLSGDKLRVFDESFGVSLVNSGRGGKTLYTPEEYARSDFWASTSCESSLVPPQWFVTIWRFNGMKLVSRERKQGFGSSAPSSAYQ